jgi:UDP-glucose 4-epimerase
MKIVVTGAKGFIGSVFALRAIERGHDVIALDNASRGLNPIEDYIGPAFQEFDCMNGIADAIPSASVDIVAHFAAATGSLERPLEELTEFNVDMTQRVFEDARKHNAKAFLWPTTSLAIGVPESPYVISKEMGLAKLKEVDKDTGISIPLRFFNVAGAYKGLSEFRKNEVHLIPMLWESYKNSEPLIINGDDYETIDGTPSRDFVNVVDVVDYLLTMAEIKASRHASIPLPMKPHSDGAIWLGTGNCCTVSELVKMFENNIGSIQTRIGPRRAFDCGALYCDPDQIKQFSSALGGLTPARVSIRDELQAFQDRAVYQALDEGLTVEKVVTSVKEP